MESQQTLFLMHITDGYSFRNTIGIIKSETDRATMVLSEKRIEISFLNSAKCAAHKIILFPQEFALYKYNIRDDNGDLIPECPIAFNTNEMFNTTKSIGRRDGIRLYCLQGENKINIQPIKMSTKDPGKASALFVKIITMEHKRYDMAVYDSEPNMRVQAKDFADVCSQVNTLKCTYLEIVGHSSGVTLRGILANQNVASINRFVSQTDTTRIDTVPASNISDIYNLINNIRGEEQFESESKGLSLNIVKCDDLMTVKVPITTVKALSKIHNISPTGTLIRFYFAVGMPTKIESPIGTYGQYIICIRNLKT